MSEPKFKVGDKVTLLGPPREWNGTRGRIAGAGHSLDNMRIYQVRLSRDVLGHSKGGLVGVYEDDMQLAEPELKPSDVMRVRVFHSEHGGGWLSRVDYRDGTATYGGRVRSFSLSCAVREAASAVGLVIDIDSVEHHRKGHATYARWAEWTRPAEPEPEVEPEPTAVRKCFIVADHNGADIIATVYRQAKTGSRCLYKCKTGLASLEAAEEICETLESQ